jgi:hypothetical protein
MQPFHIDITTISRRRFFLAAFTLLNSQRKLERLSCLSVVCRQLEQA